MRSLATRIARQLPTATRTDGELLTGFLTAGPDAEADFAELVRRHGPMVWGVCRRALPDPADAEDAFQAVFLVLVRRAARLTAGPTLGPWLHRVAAWTARNVRRRNARRLARRAALPAQLEAPARDPDRVLDLDAALLALPEKYRSPIVLCYLLGLTRGEAARRLGCPEGTLSAWLSRGLAKLRAKLGGHDPARALGVAAVALPAGLSASAVRAAVTSRVAAASAAAVSSTVSQLAEGVIHMFWVKKATAASVALFAVFALGVGVGISARQGSVAVAGGQEKAATPTPPAPPGAADLDKKLDALKVQLAELQRDEQAAKAAAAATLRKAEDIAAKRKELFTELERLQDQRAKLARQAPGAGAFVEVRLRGKATDFDFAIRETDAAGKEIGTAVVREPAMLTKLLTRIKNDPTAPKELRVIADPPTALGIGPAYLFKACDAAGYKSIKYTGYVIGGGFTPELKPNQRGDAPGFRWYDGADRSPATLLQEHEKGRITF